MNGLWEIYIHKINAVGKLHKHVDYTEKLKSSLFTNIKRYIVFVFSWPGQSPGRAIVLPRRWHLTMLKFLRSSFLCDGQGAVR